MSEVSLSLAHNLCLLYDDGQVGTSQEELRAVVAGLTGILNDL